MRAVFDHSWDLLSGRERRQLLQEWNATAVEYPTGHRLDELFTEALDDQSGALARRQADVDKEHVGIPHHRLNLNLETGRTRL